MPPICAVKSQSSGDVQAESIAAMTPFRVGVRLLWMYRARASATFSELRTVFNLHIRPPSSSDIVLSGEAAMFTVPLDCRGGCTNATAAAGTEIVRYWR